MVGAEFPLPALGYAVATVVLCLGAVLTGFVLGRRLARRREDSAGRREDSAGRRAERPGTASAQPARGSAATGGAQDRKSTRLNSSHVAISYAVFCLKKKK